MKMIKSYLNGKTISTNQAEAHQLYQKSLFGEPIENKINYMLVEVLFLIENNKLEVLSKNKTLNKEELIKKLQKLDKKILLKYAVYKDLRKKGYILKTALKFGADFRVYEKGTRPEQEHAKWLIFIEHETNKSTWSEFSAKTRVAHSTKKKLLLAIVDEEYDITYYEVGWIKP